MDLKIQNDPGCRSCFASLPNRPGLSWTAPRKFKTAPENLKQGAKYVQECLSSMFLQNFWPTLVPDRTTACLRRACAWLFSALARVLFLEAWRWRYPRAIPSARVHIAHVQHRRATGVVSRALDHRTSTRSSVGTVPTRAHTRAVAAPYIATRIISRGAQCRHATGGRFRVSGVTGAMGRPRANCQAKKSMRAPRWRVLGGGYEK